jgi:hypothetical protein
MGERMEVVGLQIVTVELLVGAGTLAQKQSLAVL